MTGAHSGAAGGSGWAAAYRDDLIAVIGEAEMSLTDLERQRGKRPGAIAGAVLAWLQAGEWISLRMAEGPEFKPQFEDDEPVDPDAALDAVVAREIGGLGDSVTRRPCDRCGKETVHGLCETCETVDLRKEAGTDAVVPRR